MKSFKEYLILEARDIRRFLKKSKWLMPDEIEKLNHYFTKVNRQAADVFVQTYGNWDSRRVRDMKYSEFEDFIQKFSSGLKSSKNLKCKSIGNKIPGIEGVDYIRVILQVKDFCAFIPLNWETAQYMNTRKFGPVQGDWCIGDTRDPDQWNYHIIENEEVPVYVFNNTSKWVVMIQKGNKKYDVWDVRNSSLKTHEGIPGFSIRKNLLQGRQKNLYDEVREIVVEGEIDIRENEGYQEALDSYNNYVDSIVRAAEKYEEQYYLYIEAIKDLKYETIEMYEDRQYDLKDELAELVNELNEFENIDIEEDWYVKYEGKEYNKDNIEDEIDNIENDLKNFDGSDEEKDELYDRLMFFKNILERKADIDYYYNVKDEEYDEYDIQSNINELKEKIEDIESDIIDIDEKIKEIERVETEWEMDELDVEWVDEIPREDHYHYYVEIPDISYYDDYLNFMEEIGYSIDIEKVNEYVTYYIIEMYNKNIYEFLGNYEVHSPEILVN